MTREFALSEFKRLYNDIDKDNHLFVGTIPPDLIMAAIEALEYRIGIDQAIEELTRNETTMGSLRQ